MHLFAPERPEIVPGRKALLIDGSAIPHFLLRLEANGLVQLDVMLQKYDAHGGYAYHTMQCTIETLPELLAMFRANPEEMLNEYFGWMPKPKASPSLRLVPNTVPSPSLSTQEDLL